MAARPAGAGALAVELEVAGAGAQESAYGATLTLDATGRALAYHCLRVNDATGRGLAARLEVPGTDRLRVVVEDAGAVYPVRIDPTFSDADWVSLNPGIPGASNTVRAMVVDGNGNLYVGGNFTFIGTVAASRIAKWNGSAWSALGTGMDNTVNALAADSTGHLYVGGAFTFAGTTLSPFVAQANVTQPTPDIAVAQASPVADGGSVAFGSQTVGSSGAALTFTITNPGTADLTGLVVTGGTGEFAVSALSATTVTPGGPGATFTVTFTPSATGPRGTTLQIASNVTGTKNPYSLVLTGTGVSVATSWAAANGVSSDLSIPGANGLKNLLNFAFGIHPVTGGPGPLQYIGTLAGGGTISAVGQPLTVMEGADIRALFIRRKDYAAAGLTYTPRFSADLTTWEDSATVPTVLADNGTHQVVSVPFPPLAGGFFQLRVSVAP